MLRSRGNRQQRPSEPSDEQSSNYRSGYSGYGGSSSSPMMGVASGNDDDYYSKQKQQRGGGGSWLGGGGGAKGTPNKYGGGGYGNKDVWDRKQMGATIKGNPKGSGVSSPVFMIFGVSLILVLSLGGATMHYKRAIERLNHEIAVTRRRGKTGRFHKLAREDEDDDDDYKPARGKNEETGEEEEEEEDIEMSPGMKELEGKFEEVQTELGKWTFKIKEMESKMEEMDEQVDYLNNGNIEKYENQVADMSRQLSEEAERGRGYKEAFLAKHKTGELGIVPGGPGHAMNQRRELEKMESLDDFEDYVQRREDSLWEKIDVLVEKLGRESAREAREWFGSGPHKVEMDIEYPQHTPELPPNQWPRTRGTLVIEMAPLSLTPIAVNLFLQQVHHKLWNGCSFVINAMHILQAGPHRYTPKGKGNQGQYDANVPELVEKFENSKLDKMPFQEYSEDYPHEQWTLGYAGRPGGPDFYINKIDNSANHGPGGQTHHDLHEEADPCFAKLVGGTEIIDELNKIPIDYDRGSLLLDAVTIVDSRVIASRVKEAEKPEIKKPEPKKPRWPKKEEKEEAEEKKDEKEPEEEKKENQKPGEGKKEEELTEEEKFAQLTFQQKTAMAKTNRQMRKLGRPDVSVDEFLQMEALD